MSDELTQYFACICYNSIDEACAEKLHRYLQHYKLPSYISKKHPLLPRRLQPLVRHQHALATQDSEALLTSRYLIVICSEEASRPDEQGLCLLDAQVRHFLSVNRDIRARNIFPIIFRRSRNQSIQGCMPPILRELKVLGIDALTIGEKRSYNNLIAAMLGLDPDILWERIKRELQKKRRLRRWMLRLAALASLIGLGYFVDYFYPHHSYYADCVERNNIPCGLGELSKEEASQRLYHYHFISTQRRTDTVCCSNCLEMPDTLGLPWLQGIPLIVQMSYGNKGKAIRQTHLDGNGNAYMSVQFADEQYTEFWSADLKKHRSLSHGSHSFLLQGMPTAVNSVNRLKVERDTAGHVIEEHFRTGSNMPVSDEHGIWGRRYLRDHLGRVETMYYLDENGNPTDNLLGISGQRFTYGTGIFADVVTRVDYINCLHHPVLNSMGWASADITWNEQKNRLTCQFLGVDGKPCVTSDKLSGLALHYDAETRTLVLEYLDSTGQPCSNTSGIARGIIRRSQDNRELKMAFFGIDGKPCLSEEKYAQMIRRVHPDNRGSDTCFRGTDDKPCLTVHGYARLTERAHADGRGSDTSVYGEDDKPCVSNEGCFLITSRFNAEGYLEEQTYFNTSRKLCLNAHGYARSVIKYDDKGCLIEKRYFGVDGSHSLNHDGYATYAASYHDKGFLTEERYLDTDGNLSLNNKAGYARIVWHYDEQNRCTHFSLYDAENRFLRTEQNYPSNTTDCQTQH